MDEWFSPYYLTVATSCALFPCCFGTDRREGISAGFGEHLGTCDVGLVEEPPLNLDGFPEQMGSKEIFFKRKKETFHVSFKEAVPGEGSLKKSVKS